MSKRVLVVLALLVLGIVVVLAGVRILARKESTTPQPSLAAPSSSAEEVKAEEFFEDEAGFSFGHPTGLEVRDVTPEDGVHYTLLELLAGGEKMTVSAKDTKYKSLDEWIQMSGESPVGATLIGAVSLDGVAARQYEYGGKLLTLAVDKNVFYQIESLKDAGFWEEVHGLFVDTFAFATPEPSTGASGGNVIYEPETVIE